MSRVGPRRYVVCNGCVEADQPHCVLLIDQQIAQSRGDIASVFELGNRLVVDLRGQRAGIGHRPGCVQQDSGPEVRLFLVLLDIVAVALAEHAPVEAANVVTRNILAMLGKFDAGPLVRALVAARDEPLDNTASQQFQTRDAADRFGPQRAILPAGGRTAAGMLAILHTVVSTG